MKALYNSKSNLSAWALCGFSAFLAISCGSYQNSTSDRDGIYGDSRTDRQTESSNSSAYYRDYFGNLHDETLVYTDAANYTSQDSTATTGESRIDGNAGWGSQPDNITVNIYGNNWGYWNDWYAPSWGWGWSRPYWGIGWNSWYGPSWSIGWGWNHAGWGWNSWYGPGWGWGYYGGWGWNSWYGYPYWNHGYYGNHYAYTRGRRGAYYNGGMRNEMGRPSYTSGTRRTFTTNSGTRTRFSNGRESDYNSTIRNNGTTRNNTGGIRQSAPVRTNSGNVRQSSPTRSYSPGYNSSGGTRSGGFSTGGGVRSGGGGRR